jgi:hypothetical protein
MWIDGWRVHYWTPFNRKATPAKQADLQLGRTSRMCGQVRQMRGTVIVMLLVPAIVLRVTLDCRSVLGAGFKG